MDFPIAEWMDADACYAKLLHGLDPVGSAVELLLILRGIAQGIPTAQLARELACDCKELLRPAATAAGTATARRSAGSWAGIAAGSGCRWSGTSTPGR